MNKYHFDAEQHIHKFEDKYLTGTSSVMDVLSKPLTWWASGLAVSKLGWTKAKDWKLLKTEEQKQEDIKRRIDFTSPVFEMVKGMDIESYISLLDEAYKAWSYIMDRNQKQRKQLLPPIAPLDAFVRLDPSRKDWD